MIKLIENSHKYQLPKLHILYKKRGKQYTYSAPPHRTRRYAYARACKLLKTHGKIEVRVIYGKDTDVFGRRTLSDNAALCKTEDDVKYFIDAFMDEALFIKK